MKLSLALLMLLGAAGTALAGAPLPAGGPAWAGHGPAMMQHMEQRRMERLTVLLDLTPAQQAQVKSILEAQHAKMRQSMQLVRHAMKQARATHEAAREQTLGKLSAVLSPEQMKKLKLLMPRHMRMGPHPGRGGPWTHGPGAR